MQKADNKSRKRAATAHISAVQKILRRLDPFGVLPGESAPIDEYDGYAPHIVTLVAQGCSVAQLAKHLEQLRTQSMRLQKDRPSYTESAKEIIKAIRFSINA